MRPQAPTPWRKTLRAEARGESEGRHARRVVPNPARPGSTWARRHMSAAPAPGGLS